MTYKELEELNNCKYVCIFGFGRIGKSWGYELLKCAGYHIDFYCDNKFDDGCKTYNGVPLITCDELYKIYNEVMVFVIVNSLEAQKAIYTQLLNNKITAILIIDYLQLWQIYESIMIQNDISLRLKYKSIIDDKDFINLCYKSVFNKEVDFNSPKTFNEKIQWLKLYDRNSEYFDLVDKYRAKSIVAEKIGAQYVVPTLGVWDDFNDIVFDELPDRFALKCTHDSGGTVLCSDKSHFNVNAASEKLCRSLRTNYFVVGREVPYKGVKPRIIAEEYLGDEMIDYKFLCFNGKVKYIFACTERNTIGGLKVTWFSPRWEKLSFCRHYPASEKEIEEPKRFHEMLEIAEKLSGELRFVRIDLYEKDDRIYFGEYTFYPGSGYEEFTPSEWDLKLGEEIVLD